MLFRRRERYRALDQDDDAPVEGVSDFADMQVDCEMSSARPALSMAVYGRKLVTA